MIGKQRRYLYFVVFICGMTSLAIELSASRLLGNVFGTSNIVWASIIGLILIYLTIGYYLGGKIADRKPDPALLYILIAWSALTTGLIPVIARPVLLAAANAFDQLQLAILFGSFSAVLILFLIPVTLLGIVSPFVIRLLICDQASAGEISGKVYAISTLGSFLGTFLPVLLFIPLIGTARTFFLFSVILLFVALIGIYQVRGFSGAMHWIWMAIVFVILLLIGLKGSIKNTSGQIYETESAYNYIQVLESGDYRYLRLNEGQGIHSIWHPTEINYNGPWEQFLVAPFFNPPDENGAYPLDRVKSIAIVGLAAGTLARQATEVYGDIPIVGYEIDPKIIQVGRQYFDMNMPNLVAVAEDGRWGLAHSQEQFSMIGIDAYRPPYIPWQLTTKEFFQLTYEKLGSDGVMVINVGRSPTDRRLVDGLVGTIGTIFPSVYIMDVPDTFNSIIYATKQETNIHNLYQNLLYLMTRKDTHPLLIGVIKKMIVYQQPLPKTKIVFTDDKAPIEWITNALVVDYLISGEIEQLK
jgi:predicted membrane-bound spermidine synthase